jgi:predicted O-linked N-acetylglucosamine transferase (SPINDLY family)
MNVGLEDLCTFSIRDYQKKAVDLAFDINRRRWLKKNLRNKILSSPLGNTKEFVKDLESAISEIVIKS